MGIATLFGASFMGSILYLTQFNQQVFEASPTESGLMLLPMIAGLMTASIVSGQMISRTGHYKIFMQVGIVLATVMVALLATLNPSSEYIYEAAIMLFLGAGLGVVMPVISLAVQNEFQQHDLGVATSSSQLFRSLGSTIGIAIFGAMLTAGLTSSLTGMQGNDAYLKRIESNPEINKIGDLNDPNTLINLNMPDLKQKISEGFNGTLSQNPQVPAKMIQKIEADFKKDQEEYSNKVNAAFSDTLQRIFVTSAILMLLAAVMVFMIKERPLKAASPDQSPGVE